MHAEAVVGPCGDGAPDAVELLNGSDPTRADTDGDGLFDLWEIEAGLSPIDATGPNGAQGDPDGDGIRTRGKKRLRVELLVAAEDNVSVQQGQLYQQSRPDVGVDPVVKNLGATTRGVRVRWREHGCITRVGSSGPRPGVDGRRRQRGSRSGRG